MSARLRRSDPCYRLLELSRQIEPWERITATKAPCPYHGDALHSPKSGHTTLGHHARAAGPTPSPRLFTPTLALPHLRGRGAYVPISWGSELDAVREPTRMEMR